MVIDRFSPWVGGAEQQCLRLCKALKEEGIAVQVLTYQHKPEWPEHEQVEGVPVIRMPLSRRRLPGLAYVALWRYLFRYRRDYDILHNHVLSLMTVSVAIAGKLWHKPTLVKLANSGSRNDLHLLRGKFFGVPYRSTNWALHQMSRVIAICSAIQRELLMDGLAEGKIVTIPNGIDRDTFVPADPVLARQRRQELGLPQEAIIVLRVGTFMEKKGMGVLLEAWAEFAERFPNVLLLSLGGTEVPPALAEQASCWGEQVRFVLNTDQVLPYYQAADIFVLPSLAEGLSNALLEAQACGLACVVTDVGGNIDVIKHGQNGLVVKAGDVTALAAALVQLIEDEALRKTMGHKARAASAYFVISRIAKQYTELYGELIRAG
jgi:glycosyltransferase involved in cell wall biosynthesis